MAARKRTAPSALDYGAVAGEMYLPGEQGYMTPAEVLDMLDPALVARAEQWATEHGLPWPPAPVNDLGMVTWLGGDQP